MGQYFLLIAGLVLGVVIGAIASWFACRNLAEAARNQAKNAGDLENVELRTRLSAAQHEAERLGIAVTDAEKKAADYREQNDVTREDLAKYSERANRVVVLEQELAKSEAAANLLRQDLANIREKLGIAESTVTNQVKQVERLVSERDRAVTSKDQLTTEQQRLSAQVAELSTLLESERNQSEEKLKLLKNAENELVNQFKALAGDILEEKSKRFTEQNKVNLDQLLGPLKTKLTEFQGKVEEVYVREGKDRSALAEQVRQLMSLNQQLSKDAHNLTSALKGQSKTQGNWGEMILEKILEDSGLRKDHEYEVQKSQSREDGTRAQPDVILNLPEDRHIVIDAKVSLTDYEEYVNAETDVLRTASMKRHLESVRTHIKGLSEKNYQNLYELKSLDFVLMFVPIEPAFMIAISNDNELWRDAWKKNVLLVSPSTLLFVVRTIAHLWRQEQQNRNAQEIAQRGAELYDKLVGFVDDLGTLGTRLDQAKKAYEGAYSKLSAGKGNVIRQAEMLKGLGIKPLKQLPGPLIESAQDEVAALSNDQNEAGK